MKTLTILLAASLAAPALFLDIAAAQQDRVKMPAEEQRFCNILETANEIYQPLNKKWHDERNGLIKDKINNQLSEIVDRRNIQILDIFGWDNPQISNWVVQLTKIETTNLVLGGAMGRSIILAGKFPCKLGAIFKAEPLPITQPNTEFLSTKNLGDYILVTATLISHDANANPPQKAIEWNGFQSSSMGSPEYRLLIKSMESEKSQR